MTTEQKHAEIVRTRCKDGFLIVKHWSESAELDAPIAAELLHCALGIAGESGEIVDAIKKLTIYTQSLDLHRENLIEELGDLEFYVQELRSLIGVTREETLLANIAKLEKRYPDGYSDEKSKERKDKE